MATLPPTTPPKPHLELPPLPVQEPSWGVFQVWWQQVKDSIEKNERAQQGVLDQINLILNGTNGLTGSIAILGSFTIPTMILSAGDVGGVPTINIATHVRSYGDTQQRTVPAGSINTGLAFSTTYAVYYDDDTRESSTPAYIATASIGEAQHNYRSGRHYCGTVIMPAAAGAPAGGGSPPAGSGYTAGAGNVVIPLI